MLDLNLFNDLFGSVMVSHMRIRRLRRNEIRASIKVITEALKEDSVTLPNFNIPSHRCAYLHKYAAFHAALVYEVMLDILEHQSQTFESFVRPGRCLKLCSLGGGAGSDAIGVLAALDEKFDGIKTNLTLVDIIESWGQTFSSVMHELEEGDHGRLQRLTQNMEWEYIAANLLSPLSTTVHERICNADLITMVKFVSAAACGDTKAMINDILNAMQEGSLLLFIDNAGGKFDRLVRQVSKQLGFITLYDQMHFLYSRKNLKCFKFGCPSCSETRVTMFLLQKPFENPDLNFTPPVQFAVNGSQGYKMAGPTSQGREMDKVPPSHNASLPESPSSNSGKREINYGDDQTDGCSCCVIS